VPETLIVASAVDLVEAAAADGKHPRVSILAYSGGLTGSISGRGRMLFDLGGMTPAADSIPLLSDHDNTLKGIVGQGTARVVAGRELHVDGYLDMTTEAGARIIALARGGFVFQASTGLEMSESRFIRPGEKVTVNGRSIVAEAGGFTLVTKWTLREVSILSVGADPNTAVEVTARAHILKGQDMSQAHVVEPVVTSTPEQIQAAAALETGRVATIRATVGELTVDNPDRADAVRAAGEVAIKAGASVLHAENLLLRAARPKNPGRIPALDAPPETVLAAAWLIHAGRSSLAEKEFGAAICQHAADLRARSSLDIVAAALQAAGQEVPRGRMDMIRAGFSTDFTSVSFGSSIEKVAVAAYNETPATWRSFAAVKSVRNFREASGIRPSFVGNLDVLAPGGELKHGSLDETVFPFRVHTEAKVLRLTREAVVNDDLGIIDSAAPAFGAMARRSLNDHVWTVVLGNVGSFFSGANANLLGNYPLGLDNLALAVKAMRTQRDDRHNDMDIAPAVLAVSPELEITARACLDSVELMAAAGDPTGNALKGIARLEVESRISNTEKFTGASLTKWYLFAGPSATPIIVAFLEGRETPTVETFGLDHEVETLGISFRVYHDFGCAYGDYRAAVQSNGA